MWHALIYVACALVHHVLEHDAECGECPVTSPNRLTRQPVRRSRLARSRPRSCPRPPGPRHPSTRAEVGIHARYQVSIEMVKGVPAVAPGEIDASNAGWLPAGAPAERGRVRNTPKDSSRRCPGWLPYPPR